MREVNKAMAAGHAGSPWSEKSSSLLFLRPVTAQLFLLLHLLVNQINEISPSKSRRPDLPSGRPAAPRAVNLGPSAPQRHSHHPYRRVARRPPPLRNPEGAQP